MKEELFLNIPQAEMLPSDIEHLKYLRFKYPQHFQALKRVSNKTQLLISYKIKNSFLNYNTEVKFCLKSQKFYYLCYDCSYSVDAALCKKCFEAGNHHGHNWVLKQFPNKPYCDCGFTGRFKPGSVCPGHLTPLNSDKKLDEENEKLYVSFLTIYTKIIVHGLSTIKYSQYGDAFENYGIFVSYLCSFNIDYIKLTYQVYAQSFSPTLNISVLGKLVQVIDKNCAYENKLLRSFVTLCNYQPFEYMLTKALFTLTSTHGNLKQIKKCSMKYYFDLCRSPPILNKLAEEKIIAFKNKFYLMLDHYCEAAKTFSLKNKHNLLLQVWKYAKAETDLLQYAVSSLSIRYRPVKEGNFFIILQDCVEDISFLKEMVSFMVQHWRPVNQYKLDYSSNSQFFNQLTIVLLSAVRGNISQFPTLFESCNEEKLKKFLMAYLDELFQDRKKCKFNSLTAKCFFPLLKKYKLPSLTGQNSSLRIGRILSVVLRNLTAFEYFENFEILKIAKITCNKQLVQQKQKLLVEWLKQYFYMRREVPSKIIASLRKQQLGKIAEVQKIFITQTRFKKGLMVFEYMGPDVEVNPDLLLHSLSKGDEVYGINLDELNNQFYKQDRCQLLNTLMTSMVKTANLQKFTSHTKKERYMICLTAVLLNTITLGKNEVFASYAHQLKQLSEKMKKANSSVDRLFKIRQYAHKIQQKYEKENQGQSQVAKQEEKVQLPLQKISEEKKQETVQDSLKSEKKVEIQNQEKQNSASLKLKESRLKKKNMLAEKLAARSKKFLSEYPQQVQHNQRCLVCKQAKNDYGLLYYFASLRTKKSIVHKMYKNNNKNSKQLRLSSCFHTVHEHCCPSKNPKKCMLCTSPYDLFIPVINNQLDDADQRMMVRLWWDDDFKKFMNKNFKIIDDVQLFLILFNSLIADFDSAFFVPAKNLKSTSFRNHCLEFVRYIFCIQDKAIQQSIKEAIAQQIKIRQNEQMIISKINALCSAVLLHKLEGKTQVQEELNQFVMNRLQQVKQQPQFKYFGQWLKNLEWLMSTKYNGYQKYFKNSTSVIDLWKELNLISSEIPTNMQDLRKLYRTCLNNCAVLSCYLCLTCDRVFCGNCARISKHIESNGCICIFLDDGCLYYEDTKANCQKSSPLYFNFLMESYQVTDPESHDYELNKEMLNDILEKTVIG